MAETLVSLDHLTLALSETKGGIYIAPERRKLASGRMSCFYLNIGDLVPSYPAVNDLVVMALVQTYYEAEDRGIVSDRVIGVPEGMNCVTASIKDDLHIGQLRVRELQTGHGDQRSIEGYFEPGMKVAVFEDVMSTGGSTIDRAIKPIQEVDLLPSVVIALVDRQYGGMSKIREEFGIPTLAFTNTTEIVESLIRQNIPNDAEIRLLQQELAELTS